MDSLFLALPTSLVLALPLAFAASACDTPGTTQPHVSTHATASAQPQLQTERQTELLGESVHTTVLEPSAPAPAPAPSGPAWTLIETTADATHFEPLSFGVLMNVGERRFTLDEQGQLVEAPARAQQTTARVVGSWPEDAWTVRMRFEERAGTYLRMAKWKGNRRWVPQPIEDMPEDSMWEDEGKWYEMSTEFWSTPGGRGGYLLGFEDYEQERLSFRRLAGQNFAPVDLPWGEDAPGWPRHIHETPSGLLLVFTVNGEDERSHVVERPRCRTHCKVETIALPVDLDERGIGELLSRGEDSVTMGLRADWNSDASTQLLHRDAAGWRVEGAPIEGGEFRDLAAGADEGLFAVIGSGEREQLWHRDRAGEWSSIELPEHEAFAALPADAALELSLTRVDEATIWVAFNSSEAHLVYALPSSAS